MSLRVGIKIDDTACAGGHHFGCTIQFEGTQIGTKDVRLHQAPDMTRPTDEELDTFCSVLLRLIRHEKNLEGHAGLPTTNFWINVLP